MQLSLNTVCPCKIRLVVEWGNRQLYVTLVCSYHCTLTRRSHAINTHTEKDINSVLALICELHRFSIFIVKIIPINVLLILFHFTQLNYVSCQLLFTSDSDYIVYRSFLLLYPGHYFIFIIF